MKMPVRSTPPGFPPSSYSPVRGMMQTGMAYTSRWSAGESLMIDRDMRQCPRRTLRCKMMLIDPSAGGEEDTLAIAGECLDISNNGLYGIVPGGYDLHVGRQYQFQLATTECGPESGSSQIISQRGTVVRTDLLVDSANNKRIGIGVRLVGPRSGVVTMPS